MEEVYKKYSKIVYKYLLSLTNNTEIVEELMQETFYSAVKIRQEFSVKTWLCKIAKNKYIDYYQKKNKISEINIEEINEKYLIEEQFESDFENKENLIKLYRKIYELDEITREVVYLRIRAELNFKEIGEIFGKTESWARVTFYRAKVKLK